MKTLKSTGIQITEDDIRAYAAHLYELTGRAPGRDLDNWLEAEACLRANVLPGRRSRIQRSERSPELHRFTMPACDTSLWIEKAGCVGTDEQRKPCATEDLERAGPR